MSLIKCEECGNEFSNRASTCPKCGCPTTTVPNKIKISHKKILVTSCVLFTIAMFGLAFGVTRFTCDEFTRNRNYYKSLENFEPEDKSSWTIKEMRWSGKEVIKLGVVGVTSCVGSCALVFIGVSLLREDKKSKLEENSWSS